MMMMVVRLVLATTAFMLVLGNSTSQVRDELVTMSKDRQTTDKESVTEKIRGRVALHTEPPASKEKRHQTLRNLLTARRRQILSHYNPDTSRTSSATTTTAASTRTKKSPRPLVNSTKDIPDVLEAQETRHGVYVTSPGGDQTSIIINDDEDIDIHSIVKSTNDKTHEESPILIENHPSETIINNKNNLMIKNPTTSRTFKNTDDIINRRKNTFVMPESLYNHFRPVESNIPVEDMTQFLYFGQKLQPENTTNNNSSVITEVTSSLPILTNNSRRRFFVKSTSTTTTTTAATMTTTILPTLPTLYSSITKLDDIINDEINIAVEKSTVDKNKISKIKNTLRNTNTLTRKQSQQNRAVDKIIASNVISTNKTLTTHEPSAHAHLDRTVDHLSEINTTHQRVNGSTQIPLEHQRTNIDAERGNESESEIANSKGITNTNNNTNDTNTGININGTTTFYIDDYQSDETVIIKSEKHPKNLMRNKKSGSISRIDVAFDDVDSTTNSPFINEKIQDKHQESLTHNHMSQNRQQSSSSSSLPAPAAGRISTSLSISSNPVTPSMQNTSIINQTTINDLTTNIPPTSTNSHDHNHNNHHHHQQDHDYNNNEPVNHQHQQSTLRIVVTEPIESTVASLLTIKPIQDQNYRINTVTSGNTTLNPSISTTRIELIQPIIKTNITTTLKPLLINKLNNTVTPDIISLQQMHPYAYTITNITRLLGNYSGARLSSSNDRITTLKAPSMLKEDEEDEKDVEIEEEEEEEEVSSLVLPPLSTVAVARALERTRTVATVSVAPTAVEFSAEPLRPSSSLLSSSSSSLLSLSSLVGGERGNRKATATHKQSLATVTRNTSTKVDSTTSETIVTAATTESDQLSSTIRWNFTTIKAIDRNFNNSNYNNSNINSNINNNNSDKEIINDRRFLRKSASAVLNQRIGDESIRDFKRRRFETSRRIKVPRDSNNNNNNNNKERDSDLRLINRNIEDEIIIEPLENNKTVNINTMEKYTSTNDDNDKNNNKSAVNLTISKQMIDVKNKEDIREIIDGESLNSTTTTTTESTKKTVVPSVNSYNSKNDGEVMTLKKSVVETMSATTVRPLTTTEVEKNLSTTKPPPVPSFSVTPIILDNSNKVKTKEEEEIMETTTQIEQLQEQEKIDPDRPFGIAKDLDPSEIQKIYRSQTIIKPESSTEIKLEDRRPNDPMTSQSNMEMTTATTTTTTTRKTPSPGERSPEVRARNLSDKTKDKDDVLPIMHLYNTSNIFNGTMNDGETNERVMTTETITRPTTIGTTPATTTTTTTTKLTTRTKPSSVDIEMKAETTTHTPQTQVPTSNNKNTSDNTNIFKDDQVINSTDRNRTGTVTTKTNKNRQEINRDATFNSTNTRWSNNNFNSTTANRTRQRPIYNPGPPETSGYHPELNRTLFEHELLGVPRDPVNISEIITKRHDGDTLATQETVAVVSYILATLVVFPIAVGVGLILRRLIIRNRKVLEESDTSSEISCRKDALNLENGDFKTSIEKAITKLPRIQHLCHEAEKPPPPVKQESRWEFPRDKLRLQTVLGQGNFGQVWKAEADDLTGHKGTTRLVAVKTVKEGASAREKEDLVRELEIMQQLGNHPNVVTLLGCCTEEEPHYLILEYVMYGKLLAYLRDHRTRQDFYNFSEDSAALTSRDLTVFGYCVARGMEYLASKKIIHRDLAARNVLVDHNKLCKIADFGMSRFANEDGECIETRHGRNALPIRWMAPESLIYSLFTTKTDVWSFGILMWEIVTLGSTPYPDMAAREVMRNVQDGYRLERPSHCRSELFRVIARCWHADPDRRPEFQTLRRDLAQLLEDNMNGHYVDLESFASECTD